MNNKEFETLKNITFSIDDKVNVLKRDFLIGSPTKKEVLVQASKLVTDLTSMIDFCISSNGGLEK